VVTETFTVTAATADGESVVQTVTVTVTGAEDPAVAQDDVFATTESVDVNGDLTADNGNGEDTDTDGDPLVVAAVNGNAASVGNQVLLASGALLTVNPDGTFAYDTNNAFDTLAGPASGGVNLAATDSFTYSLQGGGTATVTLNIAGEDSDDLVQGTLLADALNGGVGNDTIQGLAGDDTLIGGAGDDDMDGGDDTDTVVFDGANDVDVRLGLMYATSAAFGNDALTNIENAQTGSGNDTVIGSQIDNLLVAGGGNDRLSGWGGDDTLIGEDGNDTLLGGTGNDTLIGGIGDDSLEGASGIDTAVFDTTSTVDVRLGSGTASSAALGNDALSGIENAQTGSGDDTLIGSSVDNVLDAGDGNDRLSGWGGADTLLGGLGNDTLIGGGDDDSLDGGDGIDEVYFTGSANVSVQLGNGVATSAAFGNDILTDIENARTSGGNDIVIGSTADNVLRSGAGNDLVSAWGGADMLYGEGGNDTLIGGGGSDTLDGGAGSDILTGGAGADTFVFNNIAGQDTVADFQNDVDTLQFDETIWGGGLSIADMLTTYGSAAGGVATLDFGSGIIVTVNNVNALTDLEDDVFLF
ncbi:Ig-like domain-containing protein, partial [Shimia sp. SDUM112013]|uniref:Ig-like domain-containing protein n=1 Tax=Shimia sp. SDUM112013 TaxID=3136160 RepID=UPI0032F06943